MYTPFRDLSTAGEFSFCRTGVPAKLAGQVWGANVYKCADWTSLPCWLSWKRNWTFHNPEGFGRLIFE